MVTRACLRYAREGQNVTQAGPKCHTSRAKMSHKGQNVTQSCYNCTSRPWQASWSKTVQQQDIYLAVVLIWSVIMKVVPMFSNECIFHWFCINIFPLLFLYFCSRNSYIPIYLKPVVAWRPVWLLFSYEGSARRYSLGRNICLNHTYRQIG